VERDPNGLIPIDGMLKLLKEVPKITLTVYDRVLKTHLEKRRKLLQDEHEEEYKVECRNFYGQS